MAEELKKRPPRPRLDTLLTVGDVKKWLPTIVRDIDFYVKQMEVPCYPRRQIEEFERRIDQLRGEYKAFVRKIRQLEPDVDVTPWSDHPYKGKRKKVVEIHKNSQEKVETSPPDCENSCSRSLCPADGSNTTKNFVPIITPVLKNDSFYQHCYGYEKNSVIQEIDSDHQFQNQPLEFSYTQKQLEYGKLNPKEYERYRQSGENKRLEIAWNEDGSVVDAESCNRISSDSVRVQMKCCNEQEESSQKCNFQESQVSCGSDLADNEYKKQQGSRVSCGGDIDCVPREDNRQDVKAGGILNIPYSDSSSSDEDT